MLIEAGYSWGNSSRTIMQTAFCCSTQHVSTTTIPENKGKEQSPRCCHSDAKMMPPRSQYNPQMINKSTTINTTIRKQASSGQTTIRKRSDNSQTAIRKRTEHNKTSIRNNQYRGQLNTRMFTRYYIQFKDQVILGFESHHLNRAFGSQRVSDR